MGKITKKAMIELLKKVEEVNIIEKFEDIEGFNIEIKRYLPIQQKMIIVGLIKNTSINEENGVKILDNIMKDMMTEYLICRYYTNLIELKEDEELGLSEIIAEYDKLKKSGLVDAVISAMDIDEYEAILEYRDLEIGQELKPLTFTDMINKFLTKVDKDIPEMQGLLEGLKGMDYDKVELLQNVMKGNLN